MEKIIDRSDANTTETINKLSKEQDMKKPTNTKVSKNDTSPKARSLRKDKTKLSNKRKIKTMTNDNIQIQSERATDISKIYSASENNTSFSLTDDEIKKIKNHKYTDFVPKISEIEYESLNADILKNGMLEPITLTKNHECIDGRARLRIYQENSSEVQPRFKLYSEVSGGNIHHFILSKNLMRRHLNKGQRACSSVKYYHMFKKLRKAERARIMLEYDMPDKSKSREITARIFSISSTYITYANQIYAANKDLYSKVLNGEEKINKAVDEITQKTNTEITTEGNVPVSDPGSPAIKSVHTKISLQDQIAYFKQKYRDFEPIELEFLNLDEELNFEKGGIGFIELLIKEADEQDTSILEKYDNICNDFIIELRKKITLKRESEINKLIKEADTKDIKNSSVDVLVLDLAKKLSVDEQRILSSSKERVQNDDSQSIRRKLRLFVVENASPKSKLKIADNDIRDSILEVLSSKKTTPEVEVKRATVSEVKNAA
ncbi:MAG: hypothetical protein PF588_00260 [Candidatus Kapabacteria bacterium]|jgi:hypothetical protein|nr:hypothetical protein [Candidatus Kapabacteria bacterium]